MRILWGFAGIELPPPWGQDGVSLQEWAPQRRVGSVVRCWGDTLRSDLNGCGGSGSRRCSYQPGCAWAEKSDLCRVHTGGRVARPSTLPHSRSGSRCPLGQPLRTPGPAATAETSRSAVGCKAMSEPIRSSGRLPIPRAAKKAKRGEGKLVVYQALRAVHDENVAEGLPDTEAAERTTLSVPLGTRLDRYRAKVDRRRYSERAR